MHPGWLNLGLTEEDHQCSRAQKVRMASPVDVIVVGAGNRGETYSHFASLQPQRMQVVGVADPRKFAREKLQKQHRVANDNVFADWRGIVQREKFADAVFICTPDRHHKVLMDSGVIGDLVHIQHLEPVGFFHFAHSFVRGNWRNEAESSFSLLAKSCHDIDLIHHWAGGRRCLKPPGAADRCLDCPVEEACPYSARKIYLDRVKQGCVGWPVSVICSSSLPDIESVTEALKSGPYGRCVYQCDNDVCTNQVVNMEFEGGLTAAFSMGELSYNGHEIRVFDFLTGRATKHTAETSAPGAFGMGGHGGADYQLVEAFISAVASGDASFIRSGPEETLLSHKLVFEAERARLESKVVFCGTDQD
ncbi:unnamed protein product [Coregonus sp. 'balchen']|nr:unnamed protein product [Coregonus sp. 'balchen']